MQNVPHTETSVTADAEFGDAPPADALDCMLCGLPWPSCVCTPTEPAPEDGDLQRRRAEVARSLRELRRNVDRQLGELLAELDAIERIERGGTCG